MTHTQARFDIEFYSRQALLNANCPEAETCIHCGEDMKNVNIDGDVLAVCENKDCEFLIEHDDQYSHWVC